MARPRARAAHRLGERLRRLVCLLELVADELLLAAQHHHAADERLRELPRVDAEVVRCERDVLLRVAVDGGALVADLGAGDVLSERSETK